MKQIARKLRLVFPALVVALACSSAIAQSLDGSSEMQKDKNFVRPEDLLLNPADNGSLESDPQFGLLKPGEKDPTPTIPEKDKFPENILKFGDAAFFGRNHFLVDKKSRTLMVWTEENGVAKLATVVPVDIGRVTGNKTALGDKKTPEGIYFILSRMDGRQLDFNEYGSLAFPTNYPNFFDSFNQKTGHGIWLHAVPDTKSLRRGSRGCVVVRDAVLKELDRLIEPGKSAFLISSEVKMLKKDAWLSEQKLATDWMERWRKAWATKQIDEYMTNYDDAFHEVKMDKAAWRKHKTILAQKYAFIEVSFSQPKILRVGDDYLFKFLQNYKSDGLQDFGMKTLYVRRKGSEFKILGEFWEPADRRFIELAKATNERQVSTAQ